MNTPIRIATLIAAVVALFAAVAPTYAQDVVADNLQLGIFGTAGETRPTLEFHTESLLGSHVMQWKQNPKGLFLHANSPFASMTVLDNAAVAAFTIGPGSIGFGTSNPTEPFHFYSSDRTDIGYREAKIVVENDKTDTATRTMLSLINNGAARFDLINSNSGESWAFATNPNDDFVISRGGTSGGEMILRKDGAFMVGPGPSTNMFIGPDGDMFLMGTLFELSDKNKKEGFEAVNSQAILDKVAKLPVTTWKYKTEKGSVRHMGPMAQDFRAAFGLGKDEKSIASVDTTGIAFAAIQALNEKLKSKESIVRLLEDRTRNLEDQMAELRAMVASSLSPQN